MKHVGWLVNGVYYSISESFDVNRFKERHPEIQIIEIYAKEDVCIIYI